jgi:hypothetical protein
MKGSNMTITEVLAEAERTRAGHWHPDHIECSVRCPMGDPRTAMLFRATLDKAQAPLLARLMEVSA